MKGKSSKVKSKLAEYEPLIEEREEPEDMSFDEVPKSRSSKGGYELLENPASIKIEELTDKKRSAEEELRPYVEMLEGLKEIEPDAVTPTAEKHIKQCYEKVGATFKRPKAQGLEEDDEFQGLADSLTDERFNYSIDWGKISGYKLNRLREPGKLQAAFEAVYGGEIVAEGEFKTRFGIAKADFEAFLGATGNASATASCNWEEAMLSVVADFFAGARVTVNGELRVGSVDTNLSAQLSATAVAGIEGAGEASLKLTPMQLSAVLKLSGFAGARAEAKGKFSAMLFGRELFDTTLSANASVGIGAELEARLDVGVEKIGLNFATNLTFGVGGGGSVETTINTLNIVMSFYEIKDHVLEARNHMRGYSNLGIQDIEWAEKIKRISRVYQSKIDDLNEQIKGFQEQIEKLQEI